MKALKQILPYKNISLIIPNVRKILPGLLLILIVSCNSEPLNDSRPAPQQGLIRIVKSLRDQSDKVALTDPNRPVMIDEAVKRLKIYIADTLKSEFTGWNARVLDNTKTDPNGNEVRIAFGLSIDGFDLSEASRFKSIVFQQWLNDADPTLREMLQGLKVGDHVKISGTFVTRDKRIDIDPYNEKEYKLSKNIFSNPEFRVDVTELKFVED